jgi:tRNA threonylcarbamoyladenosine biosynthesis protein TsaB
MVVLALETVTRAGSLAVFIDGVCHATAGDPSRTHAERLPRELLDLLARFGRRLDDVDRFGIISGPGSFTGLRVGMAAVQGLAISSGRTIVMLPTLEAMALAWMSHARASAQSLGIVGACLDGHRGEVFSAAWRVTGTDDLSDEQLVIPPQVGSPASLAADLARLSDPRGLVLVGEDARRHASSFPSGTEIVDVPVPLAEMAARVAAAHPERAVAPHALRPIYIRRPDAVLARERAHRMTQPSQP